MMLYVSDSEQHFEVATVSGQFSGIILFFFISNKSKCCLQTNDDFIHLLLKYFYYGFVVAIMHEYENDKYFLEWVGSLWRNAVLLWLNNLFTVRDVFVVDLTVFHQILVFFLLIILSLLFLLHEISVEFCFSLPAYGNVWVRHRILIKKQMNKLPSKLKILSININRTKTCYFNVKNKEPSNDNSLNDKSKVEASETRFVWIDSSFSLCSDRSLLNGWLLLTLKSITNISSIET